MKRAPFRNLEESLLMLILTNPCLPRIIHDGSHLIH